MEKSDLGIVLGARYGKRNGRIILGESAEMRARAAGIVYEEGLVKEFIISGGYGLFIRYDIDLEFPVYDYEKRLEITQDEETYQKARQKARVYPSEAFVMREFVQKYYGVPLEVLYLEQDSETTQENIKYCWKIIKSKYQGKRDKNNFYQVAIITNLYHMEKASDLLKEEVKAIKNQFDYQIKIVYLFAEDLLVIENHFWIERIRKYYKDKYDGQWDSDCIYELLSNGKSVEELFKNRQLSNLLKIS